VSKPSFWARHHQIVTQSSSQNQKFWVTTHYFKNTTGNKNAITEISLNKLDFSSVNLPNEGDKNPRKCFTENISHVDAITKAGCIRFSHYYYIIKKVSKAILVTSREGP
jgi:hypothetical protein